MTFNFLCNNKGTREPTEIRFNEELSSTRFVVEFAFGILKSHQEIIHVIDERNIVFHGADIFLTSSPCLSFYAF